MKRLLFATIVLALSAGQEGESAGGGTKYPKPGSEGVTGGDYDKKAETATQPQQGGGVASEDEQNQQEAESGADLEAEREAA